MKVAKWGNSLAVRIPASLAIELGLKQGDEIKVVRDPNGALAVSSNDFDERRRRAIEWMRAPQAPPKPDVMALLDLIDGFDKAS